LDKRAEAEYREYVATRQTSLFRVALLLTGHRQDAEDLLQTALTKLALHWSKVTRSGSTDAYVRKILYHQQVSRWRGRRRWREHLTADPPDTAGSWQRGAVADPAAASALRLTLSSVLGLLTPRQRAVIILRYYEDLPESEVAEILGCGVGTVRSQTSRSLARLRALYPEYATLKETA
jgi:RNA polymerase sigma-70 factor (sigma-E family)